MVLLQLSLAVLSCGKRSEGGARATGGEAFIFPRKPSTAITFLSTQMNPVEEAGRMRSSILKYFPGKVDFRPNDNSYIFRQIDSLLKSNPSESILIGALHGDLAKLQEDGALRPLDDMARLVANKAVFPALLKLSELDGKSMYYMPWMQASFVMVANKKALPFLPSGAELGTLTYEQLLEWGRNINEKTGRKAIGFPAGDKGLMHRFFQGYLYPSFTRSTIVKFRSPEAREMWTFFKGLWRFVHPGSVTYSTMSDPLRAGDIWIAWDHTARLAPALEERPNDFVAFPAPRGPMGRGYMAIVSGLAIPKKVVMPQDPELLIDYLTQPYIQALTLKETGFFPVLDTGRDRTNLPSLQALGKTVSDQSNASDSILTLAPIGLGEEGKAYDNWFMFTFSEIVLGDRDVQSVLDSSAAELQKILDKENANSWPPDVSDGRPAKIE